MIKFNFKKYQHIKSHLAMMLITQHHINILWYITKYLQSNGINVNSNIVRCIIAKTAVTGKMGLLKHFIFNYIYDELNSTNNVSMKGMIK